MSTFSISASQLTTYQACKRKWAWQKIAKIPMPQAASAALGTKMHAQLEKYLKGEPFDFSTEEARKISEIAMAGVGHLPPPNAPGMVLEKHFQFERQKHPGLIYQGFIDLQIPDSALVPGLPGGAPAVIDHKSTSNFAYAKTPTDLITDPQAVIYAYQTMMQFKTPVVDLQWIYYRTRGTPASQKVHLRVLSPGVVEQFARLESVSAEMRATYEAKPSVLDLPPTTAECGMYGGCAFKAQCVDLYAGPMGHLTPEEERIMNTTGNDLFSKLQAANAAETPKSATLPLPFTAAPTLPAVPAPTLPTTVNVPAVPVTLAAPAVAVPINPPEASIPQPVEAATETKAKKTTRAKKAETTSAKEGFTLYVDCAPTDAGATLASEYFAQAKATIKEKLGVSDYRFVDYGKGQGAFVEAVVAFVEADKNVTAIVLDSRTPEGILVLEDLTTRAASVVRGFR